MVGSPDECARQILEAIPLVIRAIRHEMRNHGDLIFRCPSFGS